MEFTQLRHLSSLNPSKTESNIRLSGIVCTIGPASTDVNTLVKLMESGMNIARLNFSHGSHEEHGQRINIIREAVKKYSGKIGRTYHLSIALDTKGPEIRTGILEQGINTKINLGTNAEITLTVDTKFKNKCNDKIIFVDYPKLPEVLKIGHTIFIDNGQISLKCNKIENLSITCSIENGGNLGSKKGVNLPNTNLDLPAVSEADSKDLKFGVQQEVDIIFASFIHTSFGVKEIRNTLGENGKNILIVSKIESQKALDNIDQIIDASDGIMVARGDLGIEIPPENVFLAQKSIISKCSIKGKPVICATQMLESMMNTPRPSRADVSDIGNAILDGADCVMLSGETAVGKYPAECVRMMAKICKKTENSIWKERLFRELVTEVNTKDNSTVISIAAVMISNLCKASAIITITSIKDVPLLISKYKPGCPILMMTDNGQLARQVNLFRAIYPLFYAAEQKDVREDKHAKIQFAFNHGKERGFLKNGDSAVIVTESDNKLTMNNRLLLNILTIS